jgi:hypothetical protein
MDAVVAAQNEDSTRPATRASTSFVPPPSGRLNRASV